MVVVGSDWERGCAGGRPRTIYESCACVVVVVVTIRLSENLAQSSVYARRCDVLLQTADVI